MTRFTRIPTSALAGALLLGGVCGCGGDAETRATAERPKNSLFGAAGMESAAHAAEPTAHDAAAEHGTATGAESISEATGEEGSSPAALRPNVPADFNPDIETPQVDPKAYVDTMASVIEPGAKVIGVQILPSRYVKTGAVVTDQKVADRLPLITADYPFRGLNKAVVHVNTSLAAGYSGRGKAEGH